RAGRKALALSGARRRRWDRRVNRARSREPSGRDRIAPPHGSRAAEAALFRQISAKEVDAKASFASRYLKLAASERAMLSAGRLNAALTLCYFDAELHRSDLKTGSASYEYRSAAIDRRNDRRLWRHIWRAAAAAASRD